MKYAINMTVNKMSRDGSILGKVSDFQEELKLYEEAGLNNYKLESSRLTSKIVTIIG